MSFPRAVTYVPGAVAAVVADGVALLIDADPTGGPVASCRAALAAGGVEALLGVLGDTSAAPPPGFALAVSEGDGRRLIVRGRGRVEFAGGVPADLVADGAPGWRDQHVDRAPDVRLTLPGTATDPGDLSVPQLPIEIGTVLAAALVVPGSPVRPADPDSDTGDLARPEPPATPTVVAPLPAGYPLEWLAAAQPAGPAYEPSPVRQPAPAYVAPAVSGPQDAADGAPVVQAVICANNHLNAPFVVGACRVCGAPVPAQAPFPAPRPTLGVLVLASGETVPVDQDVLLGRAPFSVDRNSARIVTLPSPNNDLSRTHVRVALDGWLVQVTDLASTNGTVVTMPGQQPVRLRPHDPFVLVPGTVINLADEALVRFEVPQ